jgi:peptidyl-prolyl cis-trans isomerase B (cyclophilin B)
MSPGACRALCGLLVGAALVCSGPSAQDEARPRVRLDLGEHGAMVLELRPDQAPSTVDNFLQLVRDRFYDGLTFHRVEDWVIQAGCPKGDGSGGPPWRIELEPSELLNVRGALGMARTGDDRNSAGSQFYLLRKDTPALDGGYCVFGSIVEGLEVMDAMQIGWVIQTAVVLGADGQPEPGSAPAPAPDGPEAASASVVVDPATLETPLTDVSDPGLRITLEDGSVIVLELLPGAAPKTVEHFLRQVGAGFHDGLAFHRSDSMCIQAGDPATGTTPKAEWPEAVALEDSGLPFVRGSLGVARTQDPNSGRSQYFILKTEASHLDHKYANFGRVVLGMAVVDAQPARELGATAPIPPAARIRKVESVRFGADTLTAEGSPADPR